MTATFIEHVAGPMLGLVQRCTRCGEVLADYRNAQSTGEWRPKGFEPGAVYQLDGLKTVLPVEAATPCTEPAA